MNETAQKQQKKTPEPQEDRIILDTKVKQFLQTYVDDTIYAQFESIRKSFELKEKTLFSALESLQNSQNIMQKEINYKLGAIKQRATKEEIFQTPSLEEALNKANEIRKQKGKPLLTIPDLE